MSEFSLSSTDCSYIAWLFGGSVTASWTAADAGVASAVLLGEPPAELLLLPLSLLLLLLSAGAAAALAALSLASCRMRHR